MGFEDRDYYREGPRRGGAGSLLNWLMTGKIPLGTYFGVPIRMHVVFLIFMVFMIAFRSGGDTGFGLFMATLSMVILFGIVVLHEFGHLFAARSVGGKTEEMLLWPLGGLAKATVPMRWFPNFWTVIWGPLVNVGICIICAGIMLALGFAPNLNPFGGLVFRVAGGAPDYYTYWTAIYTAWVFRISYYLLLFNMLPIFPLDGGQIVQTLLWPKLGYFKSMKFACMTGMVGAVALIVLGVMSGQFILLAIAISGLLQCYQMNQQLTMMGEYEVNAGVEAAGGRGFEVVTQDNRREEEKLAKKIRKQQQQEQKEQETIDRILEKVSKHGMNSLSGSEKRALKRATEKQRGRNRVR